MKTRTTIIIAIVVAGVILLTYFLLGSNDKRASDEELAASLVGCYVARNENDVYTLQIKDSEGVSVYGTLNFDNFQKDSSRGTFSGTYQDETLLGDYVFFSEGMNSKMQVVFKKSTDGFIRGYGELDSGGTRFADLDNIAFDAPSPAYVFNQEDCQRDWTTVEDTDFNLTFEYPEDVGASFVSPVDWPPLIQISDGPLVCEEAGEETARAGKTKRTTIGGKAYCITTVSEGAAGSVYKQYAYGTEIGDQTVFLTFSLRFPQCANYGEGARAYCENEQNALNMDELISNIIETIYFIPNQGISK